MFRFDKEREMSKRPLPLQQADAHVRIGIYISISTVIVTAAIAFFTYPQKDQEIGLKQIELALQILKSPVNEGVDALRPRAIIILETVWKTKFTDGERLSLNSRAFAEQKPLSAVKTIQVEKTLVPLQNNTLNGSAPILPTPGFTK
jgi:hypothetical protein